jgi:hypothetical protein
MNGSDDILASFMAVTGGTEENALQMLEATDFQLQDAIDLFFAVGGNSHSHQDATEQQSEAHETATAEVRPPLPTKVERLYDPVQVSGGSTWFPEYHHGEGMMGMSGPLGARSNPRTIVDVFRHSEAGPSGDQGGDRLASMFEPPRDLLFKGSFEEAKAYASANGRWLILNIQNTAEFASHQLNRDTWRDGGVQALVSSSFVLFQVYDVSEEGQLLVEFYQCNHIPAILVVDPITGAQMRSWSGFLGPVALVEALMPFIDTSFSDPGAARLASRRKLVSNQNGVEKGDQRMKGQEFSGASENKIEIMEAEKDVMAETKGETLGHSAVVALPPEPAAPEGFRVAIRLPDGSRIQRRFPTQSSVQSLYDWCDHSFASSEAAGGKAFVLSEARPGGQELKNKEESLATAGVKDAMLVMKWI